MGKDMVGRGRQEIRWRHPLPGKWLIKMEWLKD